MLRPRCRVQARVDGERVRIGEHAQLLGERAVVEAGDDACVVVLQDFERRAEEVAVHRETVGVVGEGEPGQVDARAGRFVALAREPVRPGMQQRDRGGAPGAELVDRARVRDELVVAEAQRRAEHRRIGPERGLVLSRPELDAIHESRA